MEPNRRVCRLALWMVVAGLSTAAAAPPPAATPAAPVDPFSRFDLPDDWEARFWSGADARALFALGPKALAELVPVQAGVRFCRCPACDADEADEPLAWSPTKPKQLTCRACGAVVPNEKNPKPD